MAYTELSFKSRGKNYSQGFWQLRYRKNSNCVGCWKQKVSLIWATYFSPTLFCFSVQIFSKFLLDCFSGSCLEKKDNLSFDKQSTQSTNEKWWESDHHPGSYKLWQKPQLFLLQAAYWKQQTSQSSLRLNNLRMVLKYLPNGIPVSIKRLSE